MKLLVLAPQPFFQHRGTPIATLKMLRVLTAEGHAVDLLTFHEGEPIDVPHCRHFRIPRLPGIRDVPPGLSLRKLACDVVMSFYVLRMCLRRHYDLIHAVEESVFMAMFIRMLFGIPYVYDMDSSLPRQLQDRFPPLRLLSPVLRFWERQAVRGSRGVVAVCKSLEEVAAAYSDEVPIVRVEDVSLLTPEDPSACSRNDLAKGIRGRILMYVGNLQGYQGIDLLLDSFVHAYHRYEDLHLVIVGGSDVDIRRYRQRVKQIGIADRTVFLGPRPLEQLGELLSQADILVSPRNLGSNTPMKIFSYLESGTPVLATRLPTHTQVLDDDIAVLVEPNPLEMARGICRLLENKELRMRVSRGAKLRVQQRFRPDMLNAKLSEFYQEIAGALNGSIAPVSN